MGMVRAFWPQCDRCLNEDDGYTDFWAGKVRQKMKEDGWRVGKEFVCPECVDAEKHDNETVSHPSETLDA